MTPATAARALLWITAVAPWLALLPIGGIAGTTLSLLLVVASLHGFGLLAQRLAGRVEAPTALVVSWGLGVVLALGGVALAFHVYGRPVQFALVYAGAALHTGLMALDHSVRTGRIASSLRSTDARYIVVPALLLLGIATIHVLGSAGDVSTRPFDDDGNLLAQLKRLSDTGGLGDPIGYARGAQLGGHLVLAGFATALTGPQQVHVLDGGLGFALLLWLAITQLGPRTAITGVWALLLIFVAASYPAIAPDASPRWIAAALLFGLHATFQRYHATEDDRLLWPLGVLAAGAAILRSELIPVVLITLLLAAMVGIGRSGGQRRALALIVIPVALVVMLLVERALVRSGMPHVAPAQGWVVPLLAFTGLLLVAMVVAMRALSGATRCIALATAAGVIGIAVKLAGTGMLWAMLVAGVLALGIEMVRAAQGLRAVALILALMACALIYDGRDTPGRGKWVRRYAELVANIEYLRHEAPAPAPYAALLDKVPAGAKIVVWVTRPETLDYAHHRIIDLRTPRTAKLRRFAWATHRSGLAELVDKLDAEYFLVEADHAELERGRRELLYRFACPPGSGQLVCADDLEALALRHPVLANDGDVRLVKLRTPR